MDFLKGLNNLQCTTRAHKQWRGLLVFKHSISHQVLVQFDSEPPRNPPHAHSAKRLAAILSQ